MQPLMHELLLDHARQNNQAHVRQVQVQKMLAPVKSSRMSLRTRILLSLSNILLATGQRIRPEETALCC